MSIDKKLRKLRKERDETFFIAHRADVADFVREFAKQQLPRIEMKLKNYESEIGISHAENGAKNEHNEIV